VDVVRLEAPAPSTGQLPAAGRVHVVARTAAEAEGLAARSDAPEISLDLPNYADVETVLASGLVFGKKLARCTVRSEPELQRLLAAGEFDVLVELNKETAKALLASEEVSRRVVVTEPRYDRVTDQRRNDADVRAVCERLPAFVRTEDLPPCLGRREPLAKGTRVDAGTLGGDARIDMGKYTKRFVADRFMTKSRRCASCAYTAECNGVHINFVRAHGYKTLEPLPSKLRAARTAAE
jgi:hypothetical protein